jgi:hypothetical protein
MKGSTLTHNHPNFTRFSNSDIKLFLRVQLEEIRAINTQGIIYSLRLKKGARISKKEVNKELLKLSVNKQKWINDLFLDISIPRDKRFLDILEESYLLHTFGDILDYRIYT